MGAVHLVVVKERAEHVVDVLGHSGGVTITEQRADEPQHFIEPASSVRPSR